MAQSRPIRPVHVDVKRFGARFLFIPDLVVWEMSPNRAQNIQPIALFDAHRQSRLMNLSRICPIDALLEALSFGSYFWA